VVSRGDGGFGMAKKKSTALLRVGDHVTIPHTTYPAGRIVESRGPLGPGGAQIYRIRVRDRRKPIYIELREDQLELRHMVTTLTFNQIVDRLPHPPSTGEGRRLSYPEPVDPFVPQTAIAEEFTVDENPLASDVLLFSAPAAVGKSTFARALAAAARIPLLDLAKVKVSTGTLSGILLAEIGHQAPQELQKGQLALIIDALDEGRILSGDSHIEEFLRTTMELLSDPAAPRGQGPKILLFGRPDAVELAASILELEAPSLPVTRLSLDYFDEAAATELVLSFARKMGKAETVKRFLKPIQDVVRSFFDAISAAISVPPQRLWKDHQGRSFAGYAPVLAALGTLIAEETNYSQLNERLRDTGPTDAWEVLETVAGQILEREAGKVQEPLVNTLGADVPAEAYDRTDQLDLLAAHFAGQSSRQSSRLTFGSQAATAAYREAVKAHLPAHPFLHVGSPVNDVLGALVVAHAIAEGKELSGGQGPTLLADYGRQPFLWRFIRHRLSHDTLLSGDVVAYVLGSLWSDETSPRAAVTLGFDGPSPDYARLAIKAGDNEVSGKVLLPLVLRGEVRNMEVEIAGGDVILSGWPASDTSTIRFLGQASIRVKTITFQVRRLHVGTLGTSASCHLQAEQAVNDQQMTVEVQPGSELTVQGVFQNRHPWEDVATVVRPAGGGDPLGRLLLDCEQRIQGVLSLVTLPNFELTDDERVDWARQYGQLLPRLLRALVDAGLAKTHVIQTKQDTKMRVSPSVRWSVLRQSYQRPAQADARLRQVLEQLQ
jgi:hypothetical protein